MKAILTRTFVLIAAAGALSLTAVARGNDAQQQVGDGNRQFAVDLYHHLAAENDGQNLFVSPYSISSALAMTHHGARGQTKAQMSSTLKLPAGFDDSLVGSNFRSLNNSISARGEKPYDLTIANALWGERSMPFRDDFLKLQDKYYDAGISGLNFTGDPQGSRQTINLWVQKKTNDLIKNLLPDGSISVDTRLVLTNAIYFKGTWSKQFDKKLTIDQPFKLANGGQVQSPLMFREETPVGFFDGDGFKIAELPYKGNDLSMVILLPDKADGLAKLEKQLTTKNLKAWLGKTRRRDVNLWLPRYQLEAKYDLVPTLKSMGMTAPFTAGEADFTAITDSAEGRKLRLTGVFHKAFVDVNEEGTEAAAATGAVITLESARIVPAFKADHPFIFAIRHKATDSLLFLGRVLDPTGKTTPAAKTATAAAQNVQRETYIVSFQKGLFSRGKAADGKDIDDVAARITAAHNGELKSVLRALNMFVVELPPDAAKQVEGEPEVRYVEKDQAIKINR